MDNTTVLIRGFIIAGHLEKPVEDGCSISHINTDCYPTGKKDALKSAPFYTFTHIPEDGCVHIFEALDKGSALFLTNDRLRLLVHEHLLAYAFQKEYHL